MVIGNNYHPSTPRHPIYGYPCAEIHPVSSPLVPDGANLLTATHAHRAWVARWAELGHLPRDERGRIQHIDVASMQEFKRKWDEAGRPMSGPGARHPNGQHFGDMFQVFIERAQKTLVARKMEQEEERRNRKGFWTRLFGSGKKEAGTGEGAVEASAGGSGSWGVGRLERGGCEDRSATTTYKGVQYREALRVEGLRYRIGDPNRPGAGGDNLWGQGVVNGEVRRTELEPWRENPPPLE